MDYINLGKTGLKVSRICLGCMSYGSQVERKWHLTEEQSRPFFQKAIESGINFFDTANMYSDGLTEEILGNQSRNLQNGMKLLLQLKSIIKCVKILTGKDYHEKQ